MDYREFSVEDFVLDPFFRSWIKYNTPGASEFWSDWLAANPGMTARVEEARELVLCLDFKAGEPSETEIREVKDALTKKFRKPEPGAETASAAARSRRFSFSYPVAAALVFLLLAPLAVHFLRSSKLNISTTFGETRNITLPDGSRVSLNANSRISYARDWEGEDGREIWLEGEAFFDIAEKPQGMKPEFYVHAGELTIKVLGTAFNVYRRAGKTSVVLQEGSVELSSASQPASAGKLLMKPGEKVDFEKGNYKIEKVAVEPFLSWKDHRMVFENTELSGIARMLEDNYGYQVIFKDPALEKLRFTGSYSTERIDVFLKALSEAFNIRVSLKDKTITIQ
ncbi:FecR family protein [Anseongella ginsenosidimutans]|uniref:FecR family protein n=1 Tax=Anseongella ginsenosidimutans TaxID=496056 RepID=A0A4R3KMI7_9SPHI|nr:FecR domain-containing protein [Anseongella ginsenosidimutans]QEC52764.1 DUF4974 domain-containing protein [Anseongella ginsenosidimutans]TCS85523.1 FecR family protein [Anseongella ginsenosidimutans]